MAVQLAPRSIAGLLVQPEQPALADYQRDAPAPATMVGPGGRRMTLEEIASMRRRASQMQAAGSDYSPVQHWSQGLARVAQSLVGTIEEREAAKMADANAAESQSIAKILAAGGATDADLIAAAANPYIDPTVRGLADSMRKDRAEANKPQYFMSGNDRVMFDPRTGQSSVLYQGMSDAEDYAASLGYQPGTPEFTTAMQDYVLRANGPTAFGYDVDLEGVRQENREELEGVRQRNRLSLRQTPTYGQLNPRPTGGGSGGAARPSRPTLAGVVASILDKVRRGEPLTPGEQQAWTMYRSGRGGSGSGGSRTNATERTATDKRTGRKIVLRGGKWVDPATGKPVS